MQALRGAPHQPARGAPVRDVKHIGAEYCRQIAEGSRIGLVQPPVQGAEVKPAGRFDILRLRMLPPGVDTPEIALVIVGRPPEQVRRGFRELDDMLA